MTGRNVTGNAKIRKEHRRSILNYIRKAAPVSRTEIGEKTGISKPTVTRVIEELLGEGMIREAGVVEPTGVEAGAGRRPVNIVLNPSARYAVGVNISRNTVSASMVDMGMGVVGKKSASIKEVRNAGLFQDIIVATVKELIDESGVDSSRILGIGMGAPGIVDCRRGVIIDFAAVHSLVNIAVKDTLEGKLGYKVLIDNNANTRVLGEHWYGFASGYRDVIFIICSEGIGSGVITGGTLLRGKNNITGGLGLGHMTVSMEGRKCKCGGYGCIETYCSTEALENRTKEALRRGRRSILYDKYGAEMDSLDYRAVCFCAEEGDPLCRQLLEEAACALSTGMANLIGIFNPEMLILSGDLFDASDFFYDSVIGMTKQKLCSPLSQDVVYLKRRVKDSLYEVGAATLVFKEFFKD